MRELLQPVQHPKGQEDARWTYAINPSCSPAMCDLLPVFCLFVFVLEVVGKFCILMEEREDIWGEAFQERVDVSRCEDTTWDTLYSECLDSSATAFLIQDSCWHAPLVAAWWWLTQAGHCQPSGWPKWNFNLLASAWSRTASWWHLGNNPGNGQFLSFSIPLPLKKLINEDLKEKALHMQPQPGTGLPING